MQLVVGNTYVSTMHWFWWDIILILYAGDIVVWISRTEKAHNFNGFWGIFYSKFNYTVLSHQYTNQETILGDCWWGQGLPMTWFFRPHVKQKGRETFMNINHTHMLIY